MTTYTKVWPASYLTESTDPIEFDLTPAIQQLFKNKIWNRKFKYGHLPAIEDIDLSEIVSAKVVVSPFEDWQRTPLNAAEFAKSSLGITDHDDVLSDARYKWFNNYVAVQIETSHAEPIPPKGEYPDPFASNYLMLNALLDELAALLKAAVQLQDPTGYVPMHSQQRVFCGFNCVSINGDSQVDSMQSGYQSYPGLVKETEKASVQIMIDRLAAGWHHNLWPIHRYLKSIPSIDAEFENILDLLYSIEGVFDKNTSSEMICLAGALCMAHSDVNIAKNTVSRMKEAFKIRNNIVHGAISTGPYDRIKINGNDELAQKLFFDLRQIAAKLICLTFTKLENSNAGLVSLRLNASDILERSMNGKWSF